MFLYNVTMIVENDVSEAIKQRIETQLFDRDGTGVSVSLLEMLNSPHDGTTYCLQLRAEREEEIAAFKNGQLNIIQTWINQDFAGKTVFFESLMKYLSFQ